MKGGEKNMKFNFFKAIGYGILIWAILFALVSLTNSFFAVNMLLAMISLLAVYYSVKTLRGLLLNR